MRNKQEILNFIEARLLMTISTVNSAGTPESAVVGFGQTDNFELIFGTSRLSRKTKNILQNDNVSAVIGWDDKGTVQFEGKARMLAYDEITKYVEPYFQKSPKARKYKDDPDECYFLISPKWIRFTELSTFPWPITEIKF